MCVCACGLCVWVGEGGGGGVHEISGWKISVFAWLDSPLSVSQYSIH